MGKYFKRYLPEAYWNKYQQTYANGNYDELWASIFVMCELFRQLAVELAEKFSFIYPMDDDQNMTHYLNHIRNLPYDATEIY
jgi:aminoglycoside 6-adenylyltransferase